jgi:hypothetical protein
MAKTGLSDVTASKILRNSSCASRLAVIAFDQIAEQTLAQIRIGKTPINDLAKWWRAAIAKVIKNADAFTPDDTGKHIERDRASAVTRPRLPDGLLDYWELEGREIVAGLSETEVDQLYEQALELSEDKLDVQAKLKAAAPRGNRVFWRFVAKQKSSLARTPATASHAQGGVSHA